MQDTPASFTRGGMAAAAAAQMTPDVMSRIVDSAFETGVMAQVDFDQLLASQPPQNKQALVDTFQRANIRLQADAPSLADSGMGQQQQMAANPVQRPEAGFADMRGPTPQSRTAGLGGDMPMMRNTQAQYRVGDPIQGRNPSVSPAPSPVSPAILGAQEAAKAQAAENVRLQMAPKIAAATQKAERAVAKRSDALVAKNEAKILVQGYDKYIETIDELLRSPDRSKIVGRIEGNLHYLGSLGQNERQAELQAMFDMIKSADTLKTLVEAKQASPTGGSPVGNASNTDVQLVAKSANAVTQTGGVAKFDEGLKQLRREAYRGRQNVLEFYGDRYGDLAAEDPKFKLNVRPIADRYISSKDLSRRKTPTGKPSLDSFRR
jgi:soluble cytochrome b562